MGKSGSRFIVFLLNIAVVLLSAAAVFSYFLSPFWKVKIDYILQEEALEKMLEGALDELPENIDLGEIVGDGIPLHLSLEIQTTDLFSSFTDSEPQKTVERAIESNVDSLVDQLTPTLDEIAEKIVRATTKSNIGEIVREQVKNFLSTSDPSVTDEKVQELLDKAGVTDAYIEEKTDELIDAIYAENATVQSVSEKTVSAVEEVFGKLADSGEELFEGATLTEENKTQIENDVSEALSMVTDEDGKLNVDDFVSSLLLEFLRSSKQEEGTEKESGAFSLLSADSDGDAAKGEGAADTDAEDVQQELKNELKQYIMDNLPEGTADKVVLVLRIACGVLCFEMFTWAYLVLKILVKLFAKNPAIKLKLPIWLGWLPFLLLVLLPMGALALLNASPAFLVDLITAETMAKITEALSAVSLSFSSSGWVSFAAAVVLIVVSIPYGIFRKKLERGARARNDD